MDLSFTRFDQEAAATPLPSDMAMLLIGVAARQSTTPTARVEQRRGAAPAGPTLLAPATGAFNAAMAASLADWKRE